MQLLSIFNEYNLPIYFGLVSNSNILFSIIMTETLQDGGNPAGFVPFTRSERIQQLNDIDKSLNRLLRSTGLAIQTLSTVQAPDTRLTSDRRQKFEENCNSYLKTLQSIDIALYRQIHGLEEANIIPADKSKKDKAKEIQPRGRPLLTRPLVEKDPIKTNESPKISDVGLFNSQSGRVGRDMEAELWKEARSLLEEIDNGAVLFESPKSVEL
ncbi:putative mediator complex protein [Erysiphe neolycopersici]|uniref:Mediator of RNA polymerase II transcription subunit 11 n=1 Tax=Erysiphe neolycopersici TaxID=212602 RepID=A0A420HXP9_9PEZI|nr:putative mediator complex protein [Erysiphe neolycopersici]